MLLFVKDVILLQGKNKLQFLHLPLINLFFLLALLVILTPFILENQINKFFPLPIKRNRFTAFWVYFLFLFLCFSFSFFLFIHFGAKQISTSCFFKIFIWSNCWRCLVVFFTHHNILLYGQFGCIFNCRKNGYSN